MRELFEIARDRVLVPAGLIVILSGCGTSSESYIADTSGYAVTRGRITRIENLWTEKLTPLTDGLAIEVGGRGCQVTIQFDEDTTRVFDAGRGVVIVHGTDGDAILVWQGQVPPTEMRAAP